MSLGANAKVVSTATRELARQWEQTRQYWRDAKSAEFEKDYLAELFSAVDRTAGIMEELDSLLTRVRREGE